MSKWCFLGVWPLSSFDPSPPLKKGVEKKKLVLCFFPPLSYNRVLTSTNNHHNQKLERGMATISFLKALCFNRNTRKQQTFSPLDLCNKKSLKPLFYSGFRGAAAVDPKDELNKGTRQPEICHQNRPDFFVQFQSCYFTWPRPFF